MLPKDNSQPSKSGRHWTSVKLIQPRLMWAVPQLGTAAVCFWRDAALCLLEKSVWGDFSPSLLYFRKQYWSWLWPLLSKGFISQNIHKYKAIISRISFGTFAINNHTPLSQPMTFTAPAPTGFPVHLIRQQPGTLATSRPMGAQGDQDMDTYKLLAGHTANLRDRSLDSSPYILEKMPSQNHSLQVLWTFDSSKACHRVRTGAEKVSILT